MLSMNNECLSKSAFQIELAILLDILRRYSHKTIYDTLGPTFHKRLVQRFLLQFLLHLRERLEVFFL